MKNIGFLSIPAQTHSATVMKRVAAQHKFIDLTRKKQKKKKQQQVEQVKLQVLKPWQN